MNEQSIAALEALRDELSTMNSGPLTGLDLYQALGRASANLIARLRAEQPAEPDCDDVQGRAFASAAPEPKAMFGNAAASSQSPPQPKPLPVPGEDGCPEWARWIAWQSDGSVNVFSKEPESLESNGSRSWRTKGSRVDTLPAYNDPQRAGQCLPLPPREQPQPAGDFAALAAEVCEWGRETFPRSTDASRIEHLSREVEELRLAPSDAVEMADVLLILMHQAGAHGVDLVQAARAKFEIAKKRKWGKPDAQGVVEHVREQPQPSDPEESDGRLREETQRQDVSDGLAARGVSVVPELRSLREDQPDGPELSASAAPEREARTATQQIAQRSAPEPVAWLDEDAGDGFHGYYVATHHRGPRAFPVVRHADLVAALAEVERLQQRAEAREEDVLRYKASNRLYLTQRTTAEAEVERLKGDIAAVREALGQDPESTEDGVKLADDVADLKAQLAAAQAGGFGDEPEQPQAIACIRAADDDRASVWGTIYYRPGTVRFFLDDTKEMQDVCLLSVATAWRDQASLIDLARREADDFACEQKTRAKRAEARIAALEAQLAAAQREPDALPAQQDAEQRIAEAEQRGHDAALAEAEAAILATGQGAASRAIAAIAALRRKQP